MFMFAGLLSSGTVRGESVCEPATGQRFATASTVDGHPYVLLGTGVRKRFAFKAYAMALYVDEAEARRAFPALAARAGGGDRARLTRGDLAQSFVLSGAFGKQGVLHFVRDVDAGTIRGAFVERMEDVLGDRAGPETRRVAQQFLASLNQDMKSGQEIVVHTSADGKIDVDVAGEKRAGPTNPLLARAIWTVWLGAKPVSADLRKGLIERIDILGAP